MKITVFGAAGAIGRQVVKQALQKGYQVRAIISAHHNLSFNDNNVEILKGVITDYNFVENAIKGSDAVINAIGVPRDIKAKNIQSLAGTKNMIKAMQSLGVTRYITWSTPQVPFKGDKGMIPIVGAIARGILGIIYKEGREQILGIAKAVKESTLNWTMPRIIKLTEGPLTKQVGVMFSGDKMGSKISREDVAWFMVEQISSAKYYHSMPIIGTLK